MHGAVDQFLSFVASERAGHSKRLRFAGLMAALISALVYQTQWSVLRPGLAILLAGQVGVVLALFSRNATLSKDLDRTKIHTTEETALSAWLEREELFVKRLAVYETACQMLGFVALGYEFWISTQSLGLALAIGFVYPATVYFGMTRRRNLQAIARLRAEKHRVVNGIAGQ